MENKELVQGSKEWLDMRKRCITSTDAAIINGTNTFYGNSPYKLWQKKMGLLDEDPMNEAMMEGLTLETAARNWYNTENGTHFSPSITFNTDYEWVMASLDGYQEDLDYIIEIKCGIKTYEHAETRFIPPYYYDQMQHALFASGKSSCKYICYRLDKDPIVMTVERDEDHIKRLLKKEIKFYEFVKEMKPPPLEVKDYMPIDTQEANIAAIKWKLTKENLDLAIEEEKISRQVLLDQTDDGNCTFPTAGVRVERINKIGAVDWRKVCIKWKISEADLEEFRKQSIGYPRITVIKQKDT